MHPLCLVLLRRHPIVAEGLLSIALAAVRALSVQAISGTIPVQREMKLSYPVYYHGVPEVSSNFPAERRATVVSYDKTMERLGAFCGFTQKKSSHSSTIKSLPFMSNFPERVMVSSLYRSPS